MSTVKQDIQEMKTDIKEIKEALQQTKGGIKVLYIVGALAGTIGAAAFKLFLFFTT